MPPLVPVLLAAAAMVQRPDLQATCLRARVSVAAETVARTQDFEPVSCPIADRMRAFRHDRSAGVTRLSRDVTAGDVVERFPEYGAQCVLPGEKLSLIVTRGAVQVRRSVTALQEAQSGQRLFVRSDDGQILSVEYEATSP